MANSKSDTKKLARELYLSTDKTQAEICKQLGINPKTLSIWKREEEWDIQKAATNITPRKTIAGFYMQLEQLRQEIDKRTESRYPSSKESDIIMKVSKSIRMLQKSLSLTDYINAFEELGKFGLNIDATLTKNFMAIMNEFIQNKSKELREE